MASVVLRGFIVLGYRANIALWVPYCQHVHLPKGNFGPCSPRKIIRVLSNCPVLPSTSNTEPTSLSKARISAKYRRNSSRVSSLSTQLGGNTIFSLSNSSGFPHVQGAWGWMLHTKRQKGLLSFVINFLIPSMVYSAVREVQIVSKPDISSKSKTERGLVCCLPARPTL